MKKTTLETQHVSKLLLRLKTSPLTLKELDITYLLGLTPTQVKDLKKFAITQGLIKEDKKIFYTTKKGIEYLKANPLDSWRDEINSKRPDINIEALKLEKAPATLSKALRLLALNMIEDKPLKENSQEHNIIRELLCSKSSCSEIKKEIEDFILQSDNKIKLSCLYQKFGSAPYGLTKSIVAVLLLDILIKNKDVIAIYEKNQFQMSLTQLMFDRMIFCPQNFELQKMILEMPILKKISAVYMDKKSNNILNLTKALLKIFSSFDKFTLSTKNLSQKTLRLRGCVLSAKNPMYLFYKDIPGALCDRILCQCGDDLPIALKNSLQELQNTYKKMIDEIELFMLNSFSDSSFESLSIRFENIKKYISDRELLILANNLQKAPSQNIRWIERLATFINGARVPKDWTDADVADYKLKVKELADKFLRIESTAGVDDVTPHDKTVKLLNQILKLNKIQQNILIRKIVNA